MLAFYNGTWDAAHIDFVKEARDWFPQAAAQNGFTWEATTNWSLLNTGNLAQYKVIMFLDDAPPTAQRAAFQQYMQNGGAWMGFHVTAFNTDPNAWSWYYNTFLGTGAFQSNTWGPTARDAADRGPHPPVHRAAAGDVHLVGQRVVLAGATTCGRTRTSTSWPRSTRRSFPVGTDPNQTWYSGYYPIMWTNKNYKMLYANFGHNAMNYEHQHPAVVHLRQRGAEPVADRRPAVAGRRRAPPRRPRRPRRRRRPDLADRVVQRWSTGTAASASTPGPPARPTAPRSSSTPATAPTRSSSSSSRPAAATCGSTTATTAPRSLDVTNVSTADNAPIQLWTYGGGNNQQWQPVSEGGGYYHFVNRHSGKCLDVPARLDGRQRPAGAVHLQRHRRAVVPAHPRSPSPDI